MEIQITVACYKAAKTDMGDVLPTLFTHKRNQGETLVMPIHDLDLDALQKLAGHLKSHKNDAYPQIKKLCKSLTDPDNTVIGKLADLPSLLKAFLKAQDKKMLQSLHADLHGVAYLPLSVKYSPPQQDRNYQRPAFVEFTYAYNIKNGYKEASFTVHNNDIRGKTVAEVLRSHNMMVPDDTMHEQYERIKDKYVRFSDMHTEMFEVKGKATLTSGTYWWKSEERDLTVFGKPSRAVLDTEHGTSRYERNNARNTQWSDIYDSFCAVPVHPVLPLFSLIHHEMVWVNVARMRPYKYDKNVQDKLVLPANDQRLLHALVHDLEALRDETDDSETSTQSKLLKSKSSSSVILNYGPPGTGKTLTAEVYAEIIERPLYEVQCAQIGNDMEAIEANLREILNRSLRLKMPLVINEADAFVRQRSGNPVTDSIVAVFLRLLEYHTGLVFLTSNLGNDIDGAIKSRCIAQIEFKRPEPKERKRLWEIQLEQFGLKLSAQDVMLCVRAFPDIVGRDIQNLIKLTHRVCKSQKTEFSVAELRANAVFRGIKALSDAQIAAERKAREEAKAAREASK